MARRRELAHRYHQLLAGTPLTLPVEASYAESVYHCYVVRHPKRDALREFLAKRGVGTALHYPMPCHLQKCFAHFNHKPGDFPVTEYVSARTLAVPFFTRMTRKQVERVCDVLEKTLEKTLLERKGRF